MGHFLIVWNLSCTTTKLSHRDAFETFKRQQLQDNPSEIGVGPNGDRVTSDPGKTASGGSPPSLYSTIVALSPSPPPLPSHSAPLNHKTLIHISVRPSASSRPLIHSHISSSSFGTVCCPLQSPEIYQNDARLHICPQKVQQGPACPGSCTLRVTQTGHAGARGPSHDPTPSPKMLLPGKYHPWTVPPLPVL